MKLKSRKNNSYPGDKTTHIFYIMDNGAERGICNAERSSTGIWTNDTYSGAWRYFDNMLADIASYVQKNN